MAVAAAVKRRRSIILHKRVFGPGAIRLVWAAMAKRAILETRPDRIPAAKCHLLPLTGHDTYILEELPKHVPVVKVLFRSHRPDLMLRER